MQINQYFCLISKVLCIKENLTDEKLFKIYNFESLLFVLNTGLETNEFNNVDFENFSKILTMLEFIYKEKLN